MRHKTEGLVIREQTVGESDRLIWVLTRDEGVIRAFARRAKTLKDSKRSGTGLLCYSTLELHRGRETYSVNNAMPIEVFFGLREDLPRLALAQYFCSLAAELVPEGVESEEYLRLVLNALHFLSTGGRPGEQLKPIVELRMLSLAGFMPNLLGCAACGKYEDDPMWFRLGGGELYCAEHYRNTGEPALPLSRAALHGMRYIILSPFEKIFAFQLAPAPLGELSAAAEAYTVHILQRRPKTLDFYRSLL